MESEQSSVIGNNQNLKKRSLRELEKRMNDKLLRSLQIKGVWKAYYHPLKPAIYFRIYEFIGDSVILLYPSKKWVMQELHEEKYFSAIGNYPLTRIQHWSGNLFLGRFYSLGFGVRHDEVAIGNHAFTLNLKNKFYRKLTFQALSQATTKFSLRQFKMSVRDVGKVILAGNMCHEIAFKECQIDFQGNLRGWPRYFYRYDLDSNTKLSILKFGCCIPLNQRLAFNRLDKQSISQVNKIPDPNEETNRTIDDHESTSSEDEIDRTEMICTLMEYIRSSHLIDQLKMTVFLCENLDIDKHQITSQFDHTNIKSKLEHCTTITKITFSTNQE
ncbi:unnamed protein product [Moneuplotes crassus]|uniref:Uncharacterized protein n=1 Tax=Euplotes crassus TaxID=5936 RepID=A0AAD2D0G5_EUPCR|nr:unnamed protein product [Moneuplotes crassus]